MSADRPSYPGETDLRRGALRQRTLGPVRMATSPISTVPFTHPAVDDMVVATDADSAAVDER